MTGPAESGWGGKLTPQIATKQVVDELDEWSRLWRDGLVHGSVPTQRGLRAVIAMLEDLHRRVDPALRAARPGPEGSA